jgi:hypothetical protein
MSTALTLVNSKLASRWLSEIQKGVIKALGKNGFEMKYDKGARFQLVKKVGSSRATILAINTSESQGLDIHNRVYIGVYDGDHGKSVPAADIVITEKNQDELALQILKLVKTFRGQVRAIEIREAPRLREAAKRQAAEKKRQDKIVSEWTTILGRKVTYDQVSGKHFYKEVNSKKIVIAEDSYAPKLLRLEIKLPKGPNMNKLVQHALKVANTSGLRV